MPIESNTMQVAELDTEISSISLAPRLSWLLITWIGEEVPHIKQFRPDRLRMVMPFPLAMTVPARAPEMARARVPLVGEVAVVTEAAASLHVVAAHFPRSTQTRTAPKVCGHHIELGLGHVGHVEGLVFRVPV